MMNEKLNKINTSITEIRSILGEECASIEQLPSFVKNLADNAARSGFTTAFIFSSKNNPKIPTGGSLDTTTGLVVNIDEDWSQRVGVKNVDTADYDLETSDIWMSFAIFNSSGIRVTEWSIPVNLKGEKGDQGIPGPQGPAGIQGEKGDKGDSSNSYRTVSVYTTTETTDIPVTPIGGKWNIETNEIDPPYTEVGVKWFLNADDVVENNYLWMSQATFGETGDLINDWCRPFRLTGIPGKDGEKGPQGDPGKDGVVDQASLDRIEANLANAFYTKEEIDNLEQTLNDLISNNGSEQAIADAKAALDKANAVNEELQSLKDKFNEDGTIKNSVLNEIDIYNLSKAALGTDISENGVFAQQIVGLIATFGSVKADNITGDSISGKTLQSAGSSEDELGKAWKLEETGAGHIANGNIKWNADGGVEFGKDVVLSWGNIEDKPTIPSTDDIQSQIDSSISDIEGSGVSEDDVKNIISETYIDGKMIATDTLYANQIVALDEFVANKISATEITTDSLNTTPGEVKAGTIKIEGNELTVRDSDVNTEILLITGSSDITIPTQYSLHNNFGGSSNTVSISPGTKIYSFEEYNLILSESTFKRNVGAEYKLESSIPNTEFRASIIDSKTKNIISESLDGMLAYGIVFSDTTLDETWVKEHYTKMNSITISTENPSKMERISYYVVNDKSDPENLLSISELDSNITYNVYVVTGYMLIGNITNNSDSLIDVYTTISSPNMSVVITPSMRKTIIAGDGLYYIVSHDTYFVMNDSKFEVSIKGKKITLTENGFVG